MVVLLSHGDRQVVLYGLQRRNLAGTHNCFNLASLRMMAGDIFTPAPLPEDAARRITRLAGHHKTVVQPPEEPDLFNPYPLDPNRGVHNDPIPSGDSSYADTLPLDESTLPPDETVADQLVTVLDAHPTLPSALHTHSVSQGSSRKHLT